MIGHGGSADLQQDGGVRVAIGAILCGWTLPWCTKAMQGILWPWDLPLGAWFHRENDCNIGMRNIKINTLTCVNKHETWFYSKLFQICMVTRCPKFQVSPSEKAVRRMFGETRKDSKSQNTRMEGDNDNAAGFRMHSIGKHPYLPPAEKYILENYCM